MRNGGLTLLELLVVLLLVGLMLSLGAPGMAGMIERNRLRAAADQLMLSLNLARSEAVKRNQPVSLCRSADGSRCGGNWSDGWLVFHDRDGDRRLDSTDTVLRVFGGLAGGTTLGTTSALANPGFHGDGSSFAAGSMRLCAADGDTQRAWSVIVNTVGRPRLRAGSSRCP